MRLKMLLLTLFSAIGTVAASEEKRVYLEDKNGVRLEIATVNFQSDGGYSTKMNEAVFTDHFLSMRPFKCLEGKDKHWCHVPYPYAISRNVSQDLQDIEYDFLFLWKGASEYGINMWNGVYYLLSEEEGRITGFMHEMDMNLLAVPPAEGNMRPITSKHLHPSDPDSHWLPVMVIE